MKSLSRAFHCLLQANLPIALMIALLQRMPIVRIATAGEEIAVSPLAGSVLRSAFAAATAIGALDTLAGATTIVANPSSPLSATVGKAIGGVAFTAPGTQDVSSWQVVGGSSIPPGLSVSGLTGPGTVNVETEAATLTGTPTTAGTYTFALIAWQDPNASGLSTPQATYTVVVSASNGPSFATEPQSQTVDDGQSASFTALASGSPTYQWQFNGEAISGQTGSTLTLMSVQSSNAGTYSVVATNASGSTTSGSATLTVVNPKAAPVFTVQPESETAAPGTSYTFSAAASGSPTYQWQFNGNNIQGATGSSLPLTNIQTSNAGSYGVLATNAFGTTMSALATLSINTTPVSPFFTFLPASQTVAVGSTVTFAVAAGGSPAPTYQWQVNGANISGATEPTLLIVGASSADAGSYACVAANAAGTVTCLAATLSLVTTANPGRLINLSVLSDIQGSLSMGFVSGGVGTSGFEPLLIRGVGPSIGPGTAFNVPGVMTDPTLTVLRQTNHMAVASNSGWGTPTSNATAVETADAATGAFALTNTSSLDSAVLVNLPSVAGGYSATVAGRAGDNGWALTEVYDDTANYTPASTRLTNLSCLTQIAPGGTLDVGFVIGGATAKTVLVRASGPSLSAAPFNLSGTMPDPQLQVSPLSSSTTALVFNAGWGGDLELTKVANFVGAFQFISASSKDSAALITLQPGTAYDVQVSSTSGAGGTVLVEIYDVP
jgi:hypothetical protein